MTITIELGPKTIEALTEALVPKSPIQDIPKLKPQLWLDQQRKRKYVRHPGEIGNDSFAQKYNFVQNVRLFRKGCEAIGITPKKYGSNRLYIPADRADNLALAIKRILINGK